MGIIPHVFRPCDYRLEYKYLSLSLCAATAREHVLCNQNLVECLALNEIECTRQAISWEQNDKGFSLAIFTKIGILLLACFLILVTATPFVIAFLCLCSLRPNISLPWVFQYPVVEWGIRTRACLSLTLHFLLQLCFTEVLWRDGKWDKKWRGPD